MEFPIRELMNLSQQRFIANLNKVIEKYEACCDDLDDEVNLTTLEIVTDNGVLRKMKTSALSRTTSSVLFACFDKIPLKKSNRSTKKKKKRRKINAVEEINEENSNNVDPPVIDDHIVNAENQQLEEISTSMLPEVHKLKISEISNKEACFNYLRNNCKLRMKYMHTYKPRKSTIDDIFLYINAGKGAYELKINRSLEPVIANNIKSCFGTKKSLSTNRNSDISSKSRSSTLKNIVKSKDQNSSQLSKQSATIENDDSNDTYIENCSFSKSEAKLTKQNKIANYQKPDLLSLNEDPCNQYKRKGLSSHSVSDKNDTCFEGKINGEFETPHPSPRQKYQHYLRNSSGKLIKSPEKIICGDFNEVEVSVESVMANNIRSCPGTNKSPSVKNKSDISSKNKSPTLKSIGKIKGEILSPLFKQKTNIENDDSNHTYLENCSFSKNEEKSTKQNQIAKYQKPALLSLSEDPCNQYKGKELVALSLSDKNETCLEEKINKQFKTLNHSYKKNHLFQRRDSSGRFIKLSEQTISDNLNEVKVLSECSSLKPDKINSNKKYPVTKECHVVLTNPVFQSPVKRKKISLLSEFKGSTEYNETNSTDLENCSSLNNKHKFEKKMTVADFDISPSLSISKADSKDKYQKKLSNACKEMTKQVVSRNSEKTFSALQNEVFCDNKVSLNTCSKYDVSNTKKNDNKHKLEKQMKVADFNISPSLSPSGANSKNKHRKTLSSSCKITTKQVVPRNLEKRFSALQNEFFCDHKVSPKKASPHRSRYNAPNAKAKFDKALHNKLLPHLKNVPLDDITIFD